ncbi:vanadium-dependent haloperoxidase [Adhaeribacter aquaticus]|uniref:vanadium-dependent haloperoxidase n=1 Tax=Adhaeribacter aquaticus TaxID=299567 RepID=UPI0003FC4739|nr:vanadium-dependent haloperoxidase [Adhaeribacter aquaticus]
MKRFLFFILLVQVLVGCKKEAQKQPEFSSIQISQVLAKMTDLMVNDVTNPPLASRFFAYACLAGYEVVVQNDSTAKSMHGLLNRYPNIQKPQINKAYYYQLSALLAMMETAKKMQPSGALFEKYEQRFLDSLKQKGFSEEVMQASLVYAQDVSKQILAYAKADKYNRISNYPRYTPSQKEGDWYPTPPGFFAPVEPYFNTVRSFTLDTCAQFKPEAPVAFSKDKNSEFFKLLQASYEEGVNLPKEHQEIAAFWDCNPFALQDNGHLMVGLKKISPGAHWLGITGIACKQENVDFAKAMKIHTMVAVSLMDGFISCWDEKFRSNRIRPETAIRQYINPDYKPLLQTPPFPEYLSGHSTISSASAVILTHYFGDNFKYQDTVEVRFGLPARSFSSFQQAAIEAGISRFYGGIHYMDAINNGRKQGLEVGEWVLTKVEEKAKPAIVAAKQY